MFTCCTCRQSDTWTSRTCSPDVLDHILISPFNSQARVYANSPGKCRLYTSASPLLLPTPKVQPTGNQPELSPAMTRSSVISQAGRYELLATCSQFAATQPGLDALHTSSALKGPQRRTMTRPLAQEPVIRGTSQQCSCRTQQSERQGHGNVLQRSLGAALNKAGMAGRRLASLLRTAQAASEKRDVRTHLHLDVSQSACVCIQCFAEHIHIYWHVRMYLNKWRE